MSTNNNNKPDPVSVTIRPLQESDQADVARIWNDGIEQSRQAVPWFMENWLMEGMYRMVATSMAETGDIGPNGKNLMQTYGKQDDRCMFVACCTTSTGTAGTSSSTTDQHDDPPVVVGCCAVKKGMDETKTEPDSDIGSIWRMSVDDNYQGHGIATKLMSASEDWARTHGCTRMGLFTINPVAANFYMKRMQYKKTDEFYFTDNWFRKLFVPPSSKYEKPL
jgi:ribosomal protein S18 acetylase RimI-like enzyme